MKISLRQSTYAYPFYEMLHLLLVINIFKAKIQIPLLENFTDVKGSWHILWMKYFMTVQKEKHRTEH